MHTNTFRFLRKKLKINPILLAFATAIIISGCGVKGDLYQTPKHMKNATEKGVEANSDNTESQFTEVTAENLPQTNSTAEQ